MQAKVFRKVGKLIAKYNAIKYGPEHPDALLDKMSFGSATENLDPAPFAC